MAFRVVSVGFPGVVPCCSEPPVRAVQAASVQPASHEGRPESSAGEVVPTWLVKPVPLALELVIVPIGKLEFGIVRRVPA